MEFRITTQDELLKNRETCLECRTNYELAFEKRLRENDVFFIPQQIIAPYIADFFLPEKMIVIEIDGYYHKKRGQSESDSNRDSYMRGLGLIVIRIPNEDVGTFPLQCLKYICESPLMLSDLERRIARKRARAARTVVNEVVAYRRKHDLPTSRAYVRQILSRDQKGRPDYGPEIEIEIEICEVCGEVSV